MIKRFRGKYTWLSNFFLVNVIYKGRVYPSVENAFQAAKSTLKDKRARFHHISPAEARKLGQTVTLRDDWEEVKYEVMENLIAQKFVYGSYLAELLMDTYDEEIVEENNWGDTYWGVSRGKGANNLGKIIMDHRETLFELDAE